MKLTIFGGTGRIGQHAVTHALDGGHDVRRFTRNPAKVTLAHPKLTVVEGQTSDPAAVRAAIDGSDAVVSVLAVPTERAYPPMAALEAHEHIIAAMQDLGVRRFVGWSTPTIAFPGDRFKLIYALGRAVAGVIWKQGKVELTSIAELVSNSPLDWTLVRFLAPTDDPAAHHVKAELGKVTSDRHIPRASIGAFLVDQAKDSRFIGKAPIIGS